MRTLTLVLSVAALTGVAWLLARGDGAAPEVDSQAGRTPRLEAMEIQLDALTADVAWLTRLRKEEGPRLIRAAPIEPAGLAELQRQIAALEARQSEARARMDRQEKRLPPAATAPASTSKGPPDPAEVDRWMARLEDADEDIVFSATIELARLGALQATDPLVRVLRNHKDFYARLGAGTALGSLRAAGAVPALIDALNDRDPLVQTASAEALHQITKHSFKFAAGLDREGRAQIQQSWRDWWRDNADAVGERLRQSR